jgi:hypothetical protein
LRTVSDFLSDTSIDNGVQGKIAIKPTMLISYRSAWDVDFIFVRKSFAI